MPPEAALNNPISLIVVVVLGSLVLKNPSKVHVAPLAVLVVIALRSTSVVKAVLLNEGTEAPLPIAMCVPKVRKCVAKAAKAVVGDNVVILCTLRLCVLVLYHTSLCHISK